MARVIWTEPALSDLDAIADYIAIENPVAALELVRRVFSRVEQLEQLPNIGPVPGELEISRYRHLVEPPCRVFYRVQEETVFIVHIMRSERLVSPGNLQRGDRDESVD